MILKFVTPFKRGKMQTSSPTIQGDLKSLIRISFPLILFLFCESLTAFCERIFLSYSSSIDAVHASLNATYLASIFQSPSVAIGGISQVFVGLYQGSQEDHRIGPCVWQLIWFSFLSLLITLPLSFFASSWYFKGTVIQKVGLEYFNVLAIGNFLFPLSTTLASFYLGRGKTFLVTVLMLGSYALQLLLCGLMIFGIPGIVPALGAKGAALAKCMSLVILCVIFFVCFLNKKNREKYQTHVWQFSPHALWDYMKTGLVRASGYFTAKLCWVAVSYIVIKKGGQYLNVLTIGGTVITFLVFISIGLYRAILTIASNLIGAKKHSDVWMLCRSFTLYTAGISCLLAIPLIIFPDALIVFFDTPSKEIFKQTIRDINYWIWIYMFILILQSNFAAVLVAFQDFKAQLFCYFFLWPISFVPVYLGIGLGQWHADKLWAVMIVENIVFALLFYLRLRQKKLENEALYQK